MGNAEELNEIGSTPSAAMFWASVVARAWENPTFKEDLLKDADLALKKIGYTFPNEKIKARKAEGFKPIEHEGDTIWINLPDPPADFKTLFFQGIFGRGVCT